MKITYFQIESISITSKTKCHKSILDLFVSICHQYLLINKPQLEFFEEGERIFDKKHLSEIKPNAHLTGAYILKFEPK